MIKMVEVSSQLKQRHAAATKTAAKSREPVYSDKLVSPQDHNFEKQEQKFYYLLVFQLMFGGLYAASLASVYHFESLASYREQAAWFLDIQHYTSWGMAHVGPRDICYVITAFTAIISARALLQLSLYVLLKARQNMDIKSRIRFTEQAWCLIYYGSAACWGISLLSTQSYGWNAATLWRDFPHYYIDPGVKKYYLTLLSYWFTQVFIIHLEDRRKDHYQMLTHHFVTCALVVGSYIYSYTRIGHLVLIMMDTVDVFLSLAKCSKYLKVAGWITDSIFMLFLVTWVIFRHFLYMYEMIYGAFPALDDLVGKCIFDFENESLYAPPLQCFSKKIHYTFFALALALQGITLVWLVMILRIVMNVIQGDGADDTRSDSEDD